MFEIGMLIVLSSIAFLCTGVYRSKKNKNRSYLKNSAKLSGSLFVIGMLLMFIFVGDAPQASEQPLNSKQSVTITSKAKKVVKREESSTDQKQLAAEKAQAEAEIAEAEQLALEIEQSEEAALKAAEEAERQKDLAIAAEAERQKEARLAAEAAAVAEKEAALLAASARAEEAERVRVAAEAQAVAQEEEAQIQAAFAETEANTEMIYYAPQSGNKYHYNQSCRGLSRANSVATMSLGEAQSLGYDLCGWE